MKRLIGTTLLILVTSFVFAQEKERPTQPDFPGDLMFDFGFNFLKNAPDDYNTKWLGSNAIGIYYSKRFEISKRIAFHISPGLTIDKYASDGEFTWLRDTDGSVSFDTLDATNLNFSKNKLVTTYAELPVEFRIHPLGTKDGEGWFIGLGAFAGRRIGAHTKIKYQVNEGEFKEKLFDDFDTVDFRYGLQGRFGFRSFHVYYKYYLNNVFNNPINEQNPQNPQAWTVGINFSGF